MRRIKPNEITDSVTRLCLKAQYELPQDVLRALKNAHRHEEPGLGKHVLAQLLKNAEIARKEKIPICQDTGLWIFFVKIGYGVSIVGGTLEDAINSGVRNACKNGFFRSCVVSDPLMRTPSRDNAPAVIYTEFAPGSRLKISFMPKESGSENATIVRMLKPAENMDEVKRFILDCVEKTGPNPCAPFIIGVGIGGTSDKAAYLAKKALLRPLGKPNPNKEVGKLEKELLSDINLLGIGPEHFGGRATALGISIETFPTHVASMPVAVNIGCWVHRVRETVI